MAGFVLTPNIQLEVPDYNTPNWGTIINYDLNLLDSLLAGILLASNVTAEIPGFAGISTAFTLANTPAVILGLYINGLFQRPLIDYSQSGKNLTLVNGIAAPVAYSASTTNGSNQITVSAPTNLQVGQYITGSGIPTGTTITGVSGTTITLSQNATATASGVTVNVYMDMVYATYIK